MTESTLPRTPRDSAPAREGTPRARSAIPATPVANRASVAMLRTVYRKTLRDHRRGLVGWAIAFCALAFIITAMYPSIAAQGDDLQKVAEGYPDAVKAFVGDLADLSTPAGFLRAELFTLMFPIMLIVYAIGRGADLIAGEEERGGLDVLLAHPVSRDRVLLEKTAALTTSIFALCALTWVSLVIGRYAFALAISPARLGAACFMLALLGSAFGLLSLATGASRGRKNNAVAFASAVAVVGYLANSLSRLVPAIEGIRYASPFYYYDRVNVLVEGVDLVGAMILTGGAAILLAFALTRFRVRDIGV